MAEIDLTAECVRQLLDYDADTGAFTWRPRAPDLFKGPRAGAIWNRKYPGTQAGSVGSQGYVTLGIFGRLYLAHRIAWLHHYGHWPANQIDHINGQRLDNRISNLRDVEPRTNCENIRQRSATAAPLPLGVHFLSRKIARPYSASIRVAGKAKHLGYFDSPDEAHAAYLQAKRVHHRGCTI